MTLSPASKKSKIVVILGPTASGKSAIAVKLAKKFNGEVISADSRQVYKGMDIGSGKITREEMRGVPHHLLDVASPKRTFTVVQYQKLAARAIQNILRRGKLPILCGGTGLYIDAVIYDYHFPAVPPDPKLRKKLEKQSAGNLFAQLKKLDPQRAEQIDKHNKRRLVRALEVALKTKKPVPPLKRESPYGVLKIGLRPAPEKLKENIKIRLLKRLRRGLITEVKNLHRNGISWKRLDGFGLEYRYVSRFIRGLITKDEMIQAVEKESWRYTKRQMTWWRRDKQIRWVDGEKSAVAAAERFLKEKSARRTARTDAR